MKAESTMRSFAPIDADVETLAAGVVDAAFHVHKELGPGLLESVYEACLCHELEQRGVPFKFQVALPIHYNGLTLDRTKPAMDKMISFVFLRAFVVNKPSCQ